MCECLTHPLLGTLFFHAALSVALPRALVSHHLPLQGEKRLCLAQKLLQNLTPLGATGSSGGSPEGGDQMKQKLIPLLFFPPHAELQNYLKCMINRDKD